MAGDLGCYEAAGIALPEALERLHDLLERVGRDHPDLDVADLEMFETAIIEIAGNVVEHGRPSGQVLYRFQLEVLPQQLLGVLADFGEEPSADAVTGLMPEDELAEHGRGVPLAHAVLDELSYARIEDANTWRMVRLRR